ncbi:MAG: DUF4013 domain-containing protein [Zavarzinella sp.]|nr:DUF4013 domain-containing protein [Zavarzinella sp.]
MSRPTEPPPLPHLPPRLPPVRRALPSAEAGEDLRDASSGPPPLPVRLRETDALAPPPLPRLKRGPNELQLLLLGIEWVFGLFCLVGGLALLASLPVLQFLSLGYLLESGGRIARTGRLRDGFIGLRIAARLGGIVLASWFFLLPVRFLANMAHEAELIDPGGRAGNGWWLALYAVMTAVFLHIILACARGGRLRYFFWPFNFVWLIGRVFRGGFYADARDRVWDFTVGLRLPHYFWLGVRGFGVAFAWLLIPVSLLALGHSKLPAAPLLGLMGAVFLAVVLLYLPFLQLRVAATDRIGAGFDVFAVRRGFSRAPWAFAFAVVVTLLFALPLYLLKIEIVPQEAAWLPGLVFIGFIFPARLLTGWAMGRAARRGKPRHWFFRWTGRLPLLPAAGFYVLIVFFTQYTSWNGVWSLYEQHAFLVPVPFFGM